jgi:ribosomal protein S3AE
MALAKKVVKKKFIPVNIPLLKREIELYAVETEELNKKRIILDMTPELRGKAIELKFEVSADEKNAEAKPISLKLHSFYLRRMIRKGTDYSEDSFIAECKDNSVLIKPIMVTRKRVAKKVLEDLRKKSNEEIREYLKSKNFEKIIAEILDNKMQKEIMNKLKKIYPLSMFEIRVFEKYLTKEYKEEAELKLISVTEEKKGVENIAEEIPEKKEKANKKVKPKEVIEEKNE